MPGEGVHGHRQVGVGSPGPCGHGPGCRALFLGLETRAGYAGTGSGKGTAGQLDCGVSDRDQAVVFRPTSGGDSWGAFRPSAAEESLRLDTFGLQLSVSRFFQESLFQRCFLVWEQLK